jgi:hypothetical protein
MQLQRYKKHDTTDSLCTSFFAQAALQVHFYNFGSAGIRLFAGPRSALPAGIRNRAAAVRAGPESSPTGLKNSAPAVPKAASGNFRHLSHDCVTGVKYLFDTCRKFLPHILQARRQQPFGRQIADIDH